MEYIYYRPRRGFTHRLVLLVRELTPKKTRRNCNSFRPPLTFPVNRLYYGMTKTAEVNEMLVTGLEIQLQHFRQEMDDLMFRRNNLLDRERDLSLQIEATKARIASLMETN